MKRTGCIYIEEQRNIGKGHMNSGGRGCGYHYVKGVGRVTSLRRRWVAEIMYHRARYRFRSTNLSNVEAWLREMQLKFSN